MIARESVDTARPTISSYTKFHASDWMFPSKMMPTTSASLLMSGLPELPPIMSGVDTVLNGVFGSSDDFALIQLGGSSYGYLLPCAAAWSKAPPIVVYHGTCWPFRS